MQTFHILIYIYIACTQVNCQFLLLLQELDMKNPVIIGNKSLLKTRNMFNLMKSIMTQNQSICFTPSLKNEHIRQSPGIILDKSLSTNLLQSNTNFKKPWIFFGKVDEMYSPVNIPLYSFENETLWENFEFKSIRKKNKLARIIKNKLYWNNQQKKNFFERRGNFENITLIGMTDAYNRFIKLPKGWQKVAKVSTVVKDTYEVRNLHKY